MFVPSLYVLPGELCLVAKFCTTGKPFPVKVLGNICSLKQIKSCMIQKNSIFFAEIFL